MTDSISPLYAEILGETARISWQELAPWFAKGKLLWVTGKQDLVAVAEAIARDDKQHVTTLLHEGHLQHLSDELAHDYQKRDPELWATVVRPWVLVQERDSKGQTDH
ncbi:MAG: DUF2288 domain-containing protein [Gammaproteobacteria bacterium]|jgi:hypothetical protein|nr:DUF2288 domain-containing protein [Gammaproteobacteria bacterium]